MFRRIRPIALAVAVVGIVSALAAIAHARPLRAAESNGDPSPFVVMTGRLEVPEGTEVDDAVIFDGPLVVDGTVNGDAVAFNGDIVVNGSVRGEVTAVNGGVTVNEGARVGGDVVSRETPSIARGTVSGTVSHRGVTFDAGSLRFVGRFVLWIAATVTSFLIGLMLTLLLPRAADAIAETARRRTGATVGWGIACFFGIPVVAVILLATLIAGLLGLGTILALLLIYSIAYAAGAYAVGRWVLPEPRPRFVAFLLAWAILRVLALVPVLGGLLFIAVAAWGLGTIVVAGFRAGRGAPRGPEPMRAPTGPEPGRALPTAPPLPPTPSMP